MTVSQQIADEASALPVSNLTSSSCMAKSCITSASCILKAFQLSTTWSQLLHLPLGCHILQPQASEEHVTSGMDRTPWSGCHTMMQAATRLGGPVSSRRIAPMYWKLWSDWATIAMRIACATKKPDKPLNIGFSASEIMCLAELLQQKQDLLSVCVYGKDSMTCLQVHACK